MPIIIARYHIKCPFQNIQIVSRVVDPVHFHPDPANQNVKNRIRILLLLAPA